MGGGGRRTVISLRQEKNKKSGGVAHVYLYKAEEGKSWPYHVLQIICAAALLLKLLVHKATILVLLPCMCHGIVVCFPGGKPKVSAISQQWGRSSNCSRS